MNNNEKVGLVKTNINWYPGHMAKTKREIQEKIKLIDIIYEVVDARMPKTSKMKGMDEILRDIPRIMIMTKKDLCDINKTQKWIDYYESIGVKVCIMDLTNDNDYKSLISITKNVINPINEKRKEKGLLEKEIKIGVIGIPNVGKSTLINKLAHRRVANVGNKPGVTKQINWLKTDYGFLMLDTPGILWPNLGDSNTALALASTATINSDILDMTDIGYYLLSFYKNKYPNILNDIYNIDTNLSIDDMFLKLGNKYGLVKDDEIDYERISIKLYNDLISGKIRGVTFDE